MKRSLYLILFLFIAGPVMHAQDDGAGNDKIREKMAEFIQRRLELNPAEAEKFNPVFFRYFKEWRATLREFRGDRLILQQKIVELRLRYRNEFAPIIGGKRSNDVYRHQELFIQGMKRIREGQLEKRKEDRPFRRNRGVI